MNQSDEDGIAMPVFTYVGRNQAGQKVNGVIEADNTSAAVSVLRSQGLWVSDLKTSGGAPARATPSDTLPAPSLVERLFQPAPVQQLSMFYHQVYTLLYSGVGIYQAFELLSQPGQSTNGRIRAVAAEMAQATMSGDRMSTVMRRHPGLFDKMQLRMVEAGENGGFLAEVCRRLADYLEREHKIRQDISRRTLYPKFVIGLLFLVYPIRIPLTLAGYLGDVATQSLWLAGVGIPLWLFLRLFLSAQATRALVDQFKLLTPMTGKLVRKLAVARFARTLAALYSAGVGLATAATMSAEASGNAVLERRMAEVMPGVERGGSLCDALEATRFFPPIFLGMVRTGETTGGMDLMLDNAAATYEEEASHSTAQLVVTLGVGVLLLVGIMVGVKVIGFFGGMYTGLLNSANG